MKENLKRILSAVLMLAMLLTLCLPLTACNPTPPDNGDGGGDGDGGNGGDGGDGGKITYTVSVKTFRNMPLEGVMCYVHKGTGYNSVGRAETNEQGIATFTLDAATDYTIELDGVPDGYNVQDRYEMGTSGATITLKSAPIPADEGTIGDVPYYQLGDIIHDFTLTDVNGNTYTVSEVLAEKKLLLLNFWYNGCDWCYREFPYMSAAYDRYSDQVEIFAINDYGDSSKFDNTANGVKNFTVTNSDGELVTLNFPKFKVTTGDTDQPIISKFDPDQNGYPVTVAIDRDGMICMVEVGGIISSKPFVNMFDHFIAENYQQKIVESIAEFTPVETPNVSQPSSEEIAEVLSGTDKGAGKIDAFYHPETEDLKADMIWPFVISTKNGVSCVKPSNIDKDNSSAIMYAEVEMKAGDALMFDYWGSTQQGYDILYVIVDGKDIISISGENNTGDWEKACAYVARETRKYEVAFAYVKDAAEYRGEDTVYIKDLRIVDKSQVDVEAFIFRYAATDENAAKTEFGSYVSVVLGDDGYYHVDTKDGPLLLVNMLGYTRFDPESTVFDRLYSDMDATGKYTFIIDGKEVFPAFEEYGNIASRSKMYGITPVTEELRAYLVAYTEKYRQETGKIASENMWLQLCCYYDAYGTSKQLEDPIKGLSSFSAYDAEIGVNTDSTKVNEVVYDRMLVPRGLLYKFVPTESGVYRITSRADEAVLGWIFTGNHTIWAANSGERTIYVDSENPERIITELIYVRGYTVECAGCGATLSIKEDAAKAICSDSACGHVTTDLSAKKEVKDIDRNNVSMVAYFEAGVEYYISIAFHTVEQLGSFTFDLVRVGDTYDAFVMASPGVFTYELGDNGELGSTIIGGIKAKLCDVDGCAKCIAAANEAGAPATTKYYHHLKADGSLGSIIYADFTLPTTIFSQTIVQLLNVNGFNFTVSETDREALELIADMRAAGKTALFKQWDKDNGKALPKQVKEDRWAEHNMDAAIAGDMSGVPAGLVSTVTAWVKIANDASEAFLREKWGDDFEKNWNDFRMDDVLEGIFHPTAEEQMSILDKTAVSYFNAGLTYAKEQILRSWTGTAEEKEARWESYDIENALAGKYDGIPADILNDAKAVAAEALNKAKAFIKETWETPDAEGMYRDFETYWEFYQMDDIVNQVYHGYAFDRTEELAAYIDRICTSESNPERVGCVAVDETVAEILQLAMDAYTFPNLELGWLKFCYYYQTLGE